MEQVSLKKIKDYCKDFGEQEVSKAIRFVSDQYEENSRRIEDLCKIIGVLLPLNPDKETIIAILLSELYTEKLISQEEVIKEFGEEINGILEALSRMDSIRILDHDKSSQTEVLRKMFLTMAKDLRVVLIWLAWRVFLMEKLDEMEDEEKRKKIATETVNIYAPIAARLGIYRIKTLLEDLSFKHINRKDFDDVKNQIKKLGGSQKSKIEEMSKKLQDFLASKGIKGEVTGRIKSIYSIYRKLKKKNLTSVNDIYDFFAMRIILPGKSDGSVDHLYSTLGMIHSEWKPLSSRFKDYIAVPKVNNYRSLHTVIIGLDEKDPEKPIEIQIRDQNMHKEAEGGIASHWVYKTTTPQHRAISNVPSQSEWLKGLERIYEFFNTEFEGIKGLDVDIFKDRIFVLTPKGEVKDLPHGATPIDYAYSIHTDIGNKCIMAKINNRAVSLDSELKNGDVIEILTKRNMEPKQKWLSFVKTNLAKKRIKEWFSEKKN
jgi:GTP diphosphokinase / guanosine-3',5'-bis(diphosphate) 3'-diphosphatase